MISYQGIVCSIGKHQIEVSVQEKREAACGGCAQQTTCSSVEGQSRARRYFFKLPVGQSDIAIGDYVNIQIPKKAFWSALLYAYLLPTGLSVLTMIFLSAWLDGVLYHELWLALGGLSAAAVGISFASVINRRYQPKLVRLSDR